MDGLTALGALGSANPVSSPNIPAHAVPAAAVATPQDSTTFGMPPAEAVAIDCAPSPSPSAQRAGSASLSLSLKYAPSAVPSDVRRAGHFDRTA
jgi:hypothetical protein